MLNEIDDFVIDHGFQPIVNRLLMHPMDVAMITTTGASVLLATGTIIGVDWTNYTVVPIVVVAIMAQFCALWVSRQTFPRMKSLIKPGMRNPFRETNRNQRCLLVPPAIMMIIIIVSVLPYLKGLFLFLGFVCWLTTTFFQACDYPPIKPKFNPIPIHRDLVAE
jgi:hypothetical protein